MRTDVLCRSRLCEKRIRHWGQQHLKLLGTLLFSPSIHGCGAILRAGSQYSGGGGGELGRIPGTTEAVKLPRETHPVAVLTLAALCQSTVRGAAAESGKHLHCLRQTSSPVRKASRTTADESALQPL